VRYSTELNIFLKSYVGLKSESKAERVKNLSTENLLALLRNIEENASWYEEEVIKGVASVLYDRNIILM
jgi:NADH:ubiquinone oxidoreductase subunit E